MNRQEAYDIVVAHLFTQGRRAYDEDNGCLYRGPNGAKCAVGVLIPDEQYNPAMEGCSVGGLVGSSGYKIPSVVRRNADLMQALQSVHDDCCVQENGSYFMPELYERLLGVADYFGLSKNVLLQYKPEGN